MPSQKLPRNAVRPLSKVQTLLRYRGAWLSEASMTVARVILWACMLAALATPLPAFADPAGANNRQSDRSPYMRVFGVSQPPYGFVKFCEREPERVPPGSSRGAALLGGAGPSSRTRRRQSCRQSRDRAGHRPRSLRPDRILDDPDHPRRLRGLCAAEAQAPDRPRLADQLAADDCRARREGRRPCRAHRPHRAGRLHPRQQDRRGEGLVPARPTNT